MMVILPWGIIHVEFDCVADISEKYIASTFRSETCNTKAARSFETSATQTEHQKAELI
jgi:hypothetical protein